MCLSFFLLYQSLSKFLVYSILVPCSLPSYRLFIFFGCVSTFWFLSLNRLWMARCGRDYSFVVVRNPLDVIHLPGIMNSIRFLLASCTLPPIDVHFRFVFFLTIQKKKKDSFVQLACSFLSCRIIIISGLSPLFICLYLLLLIRNPYESTAHLSCASLLLLLYSNWFVRAFFLSNDSAGLRKLIRLSLFFLAAWKKNKQLK